jgi:lysophospholipase L1-like esterase
MADQGMPGASRGAWIWTALLALVVPAAFFGLIEAGIRLFVHVPKWQVAAPGTCTRRDPLLGYSFLPSCVGRMGTTPVRTNAFGLRGEEVADDGRRRILAIGDSCTWGYQVKEEQSYPVLLRRLLDASPHWGRYRVVNAGTPGYTSYHGLVYLRERGLELHPALVLIAYEWNDGIRMGDVERRLERIRRLHRILEFDDWLRRTSDFYRLLALHLGPRALPGLGPQVLPKQYRENMTAMIQLAREHGARPALIDWNAAGPDYSNVLDEVSAEAGVPLVRFYGPRIPGDVVHPTAEGYRRFVTVLYRRLREAGYLDGH